MPYNDDPNLDDENLGDLPPDQFNALNAVYEAQKARIVMLEAKLKSMRELAEKWQAKKYDGDLTKAVYDLCAAELRRALKGAS